MLILGIDTATAQVGVAIGDHDGCRASFSSATGMRHAEALVPALQFTCAQAGIALSEIKVVAVDTGPGLFTGLRVGVATAKAVAQALHAPMIGLSSLDLLAFSVRHSHREIVPVIDARRGEVFFSRYRHTQGGIQRLAGPNVCRPEELANDLRAGHGEVLAVGDGALRYASILAIDSRIEIGSVFAGHPSAVCLVELAHPRALREEFVTPLQIEPTYLRKPDAEINWQTRDAAPGGRGAPRGIANR
ncbi:MAG: tRNA (adenosine(37)-N6)-threonylcarbamoyltransferase complex dimerization subunit type 1 TsaB [Acidimicrobiales bacterium]